MKHGCLKQGHWITEMSSEGPWGVASHMRIVLAIALLSTGYGTVFAGEPRLIRLTDDAQRFQDGTPLALAMFTSSGGSQGVSADFTNTKWDIANIPQTNRSGFIVGVQTEGKRFTHSVFLEVGKFDTFIISEQNIVFPAEKKEIDKDGPFVRVIFYAKNNERAQDPAPLSGWKVSVDYRGKLARIDLPESGVLDLSEVTHREPINLLLTSPDGRRNAKSVLFPAFRGASKGLVVFKAWDIADVTDFQKR